MHVIFYMVFIMFYSVALLFIIITINIIRRLIIMTLGYLELAYNHTPVKRMPVPDLMVCKLSFMIIIYYCDVRDL